jgi:hypothetical protein
MTMNDARRRLSAIVCASALVWLLVLPWLAARPQFARLWQRTEQAGVDPSAFNYRELPAAEDIYAELTARTEQRPEAWGW